MTDESRVATIRMESNDGRTATGIVTFCYNSDVDSQGHDGTTANFTVNWSGDDADSMHDELKCLFTTKGV